MLVICRSFSGKLQMERIFSQVGVLSGHHFPKLGRGGGLATDSTAPVANAKFKTRQKISVAGWVYSLPPQA